MHILIWIGRSSGMQRSATFLNSAGRFSTSSQRSFRNPNSIEPTRRFEPENKELVSLAQPKASIFNEEKSGSPSATLQEKKTLCRARDGCKRLIKNVLGKCFWPDF